MGDLDISLEKSDYQNRGVHVHAGHESQQFVMCSQQERVLHLHGRQGNGGFHSTMHHDDDSGSMARNGRPSH